MNAHTYECTYVFAYEQCKTLKTKIDMAKFLLL